MSILATGECSAYTACRRTQMSSLQLGLWVGGHLVRPTFA